MNELTKVAIIDDEELAAKTLADLVEICGFDSYFCCDPSGFFGLVQSINPSVVFIDLKMPDMDGVEVVKQLSKIGFNGQVVLISGEGTPLLSSARRVAGFLGLPILGVLKKPFDLEILTTLLQALGNVTAKEKLAQVKGVSINALEPEPLIASLKQAINNDLLHINCQPKVNCLTETLEGFEILSRWHDSIQGNIPPDVFIALAEVHGLIDLLTIQVVEKSIAWLSEFDKQSAAELDYSNVMMPTISINISAQSLSNEILFNKIIGLCGDNNVSPSRIILELTESVALDDSSLALEHLTRLRLRGFQLSIDDFGTGYSSLAQLAKVPFSEIKIDKTFITDICTNHQSATISRCIAEMGHSLSLNVTAEGIEDQETMALLRKTKCDTVQGYYIAKPMPPEQVFPWLKSRLKKREVLRLEALRQLAVLDTPAESRYDRVTRLASKLLDVPISLVSLIDEDRQWFKSSIGLDQKETKRSIAFCDTAIKQDDVFVVEDASIDERFDNNPLVNDTPNIRFYAGQPIIDDNGYKLGTLCVIDSKPRHFSNAEARLLKKLSQLVGNEIIQPTKSVLDEKAGLLPKGSYTSQSKKLHDLCIDIKVDMWVINVRVMDVLSLERKLGSVEMDNLIRKLGNELNALSEFTDLVGKKDYSEFALVYMALSHDELFNSCDEVVEVVNTWRESYSPKGINVDIEVGYAKVPYNDNRKLDKIISDNWRLYIGMIEDGG